MHRWLIISSVIVARAIYALNWFNISPGLLGIQVEFGVDLPSLGVLTSAFILGAGFFQVPAGILSTKIGPKDTSVLGMLILSSSGLAEGLSPSFPVLIGSRFLLGLGAAFFFAPAIGVIVQHFKPEEEGFVVGLYNAAFSIGAGMGIFAWSIVIEALGWRWGLVLGGLLGLSITVENWLVVPPTRPALRSNGLNPKSLKVLTNRNIWLLGLGTVGMWGCLFTASQFYFPYLAATAGFLSFGTIGIMSSLSSFASIPGGPVGGHLSDRLRNRKSFVLVPTAGMALVAALTGSLPVIGLWVAIPLLGLLASFVFASLYSSPRQYADVGPFYAPLAIGLINSSHMLGSFWMPIGFTIIAATFSYQLAWVFLGVSTAAFVPLILFAKEPFDRRD